MLQPGSRVFLDGRAVLFLLKGNGSQSLRPFQLGLSLPPRIFYPDFLLRGWWLFGFRARWWGWVTSKGEKVANVLGLGINQGFLHLKMSTTLLLVPPTASPRRLGCLPTPPIGGRGDWVTISCWGCCLERRNITICPSVCLGFQENLCGGRESIQAFLCVLTVHVALEKFPNV